MAGTQVQFRRGTTAEHASFTGAVGEVTVDTTKDTLVVHDGSLAGGHPLAKANQIIVGNTSVTVTDTGSDGKVVIATDGAERIIIDPANAYGVLTTQGATGYIANVVASGDGVRGIWAANANSDVRFGSNTNHPLALYTNNGERMRITSNGNVGIGTSSTTERLTVEEENGCMALVKTSTSGFASCTVQYGTQGTVGLASGDGAHSIYGDGAIPLLFYTNATERMRITAGGEVYIAGTTDQGAYNLQCNGTGVWGAGAYVNGSDERIKDAITPIVSGLDVVEKLNPVTYRYKESWTKDQSVQTGFIAQELLVALEDQIYAEGVVQQGGSEGYYSVAYQNLIPILTKAIQEQQEIITALTARIEALENA